MLWSPPGLGWGRQPAGVRAGNRPAQGRQVVKLRLAASELNELNRLCIEHGVSRALLLRRAIEYGLPPAVDSLDVARSAGMSLRTGRPIRTLQTTRYGPRTLQPITAVFGAESPGQRLNRRSLRYPVPEES